MDEGLILPVLWIEVTSGDLSEDVRSFLYHSTFSVNAIQYALKYGTLLTCLTSFALIVAGCYYLSKMREEQMDSKPKDRAELETLNKVPKVASAPAEIAADV